MVKVLETMHRLFPEYNAFETVTLWTGCVLLWTSALLNPPPWTGSVGILAVLAFLISYTIRIIRFRGRENRTDES